MGGSSVRHGQARAPLRFLEAYVKFLICTIGAPSGPPRLITFAYCSPPDFNASSRQCTQQMGLNVERGKLFIVVSKVYDVVSELCLKSI